MRETGKTDGTLPAAAAYIECMAAKREITIGFFDSGTGGLSVLAEFLKHSSFARAIYLGDNENAPYGNRSRRELVSLARAGAERLAAAGADVVVFACGTISTNALEAVKTASDVPVFGVFPPAERCVLSGKRTAVFATPRTAQRLSGTGADVFALPDLAGEIERCAPHVGKVCVKNHLPQTAGDYGAVVLGCTHYALVAEQFAGIFPRAEIVWGGQDTARAVNSFLNGVYGKKEGKDPLCGADYGAFRKKSDHFCPKKTGGLTTFADFSEKISKSGEKSAFFNDFFGKKVFFIGNAAELNFRTFVYFSQKYGLQ